MEDSAGRGEPVAEAQAPIARRSLHDQVVGRVRDLITDGTLEPGSRIKEGQLGAQGFRVLRAIRVQVIGSRAVCDRGADRLPVRAHRIVSKAGTWFEG